MCQAHKSDTGKYPRWSPLRSKIEMSKSKIENAKIENSKNPRLLSEESAEHPTLPLPVRGRCPSLKLNDKIEMYKLKSNLAFTSHLCFF